MTYWTIIARHRRPLTYGLVLTFFSNFGQTFFISLFVPSLLRDFALAETTFAALYSGATLASAACLPFLGARIDKVALRPYTSAIVLGLLARAPLWARPATSGFRKRRFACTAHGKATRLAPSLGAVLPHLSATCV